MLIATLCAAFIGSCVVNYLLPSNLSFLFYTILLSLSFWTPLWILVIWKVFVYPLYFSPYLSLPQAPQSKSWRRMFTSINHGKNMLELVDSLHGVGLFRALDLMNRETLIVTNPAGIKDVLQNNSYDYSKNPNTQDYIAMWLGKGLVYAEGTTHKIQRKALSPAFNFRHVKELYPLFWTKSSEMVSLLKEDIAKSREISPENEPITNIADWAGRTSLDIIGIAGFGLDFSSLSKPQNPVFKAYQGALGVHDGSRLHFFLALLFPIKLVNALPISAIQQMTSNSAYIKAYMKKFLNERRQNGEKVTSTPEDKGEIDLISVATKFGGFSNEDILNQATTFLGAGHETTATSVTWAIYVLSQPRYAHIQQKLRKEIRENLPRPSSGATVDAHMLDRLPYLDAVFREAVRLYPPAQAIRRYTIRDTVISGTTVKKGTYVQIPTWAINQSRDLWGENGRDFIPERWLEGENKASGGTDNVAFLSFSYGSRNCIGKNFAFGENKAIIAALVGSFEIVAVEPDKEIAVDWAIVTKMVGGWKVYLKPVDD